MIWICYYLVIAGAKVVIIYHITIYYLLFFAKKGRNQGTKGEICAEKEVIIRELTQSEGVNELRSWELMRGMGVIERELMQNMGDIAK